METLEGSIEVWLKSLRDRRLKFGELLILDWMDNLAAYTSVNEEWLQDPFLIVVPPMEYSILDLGCIRKDIPDVWWAQANNADDFDRFMALSSRQPNGPLLLNLSEIYRDATI